MENTMGLLPPARSAFGEREISVHRVEVGQGKMGRDNGCAPKWFTGGFLFVSELLVAYGRVRGMDYTSGAARWKVRKRLVMPVVSDRRTLLRPRTAALRLGCLSRRSPNMNLKSEWFRESSRGMRGGRGKSGGGPPQSKTLARSRGVGGNRYRRRTQDAAQSGIAGLGLCPTPGLATRCELGQLAVRGRAHAGHTFVRRQMAEGRRSARRSALAGRGRPCGSCLECESQSALGPRENEPPYVGCYRVGWPTATVARSF